MSMVKRYDLYGLSGYNHRYL